MADGNEPASCVHTAWRCCAALRPDTLRGGPREATPDGEALLSDRSFFWRFRRRCLERLVAQPPHQDKSALSKSAPMFSSADPAARILIAGLIHSLRG